MKLEHVALNVAKPLAMAAWYQEHLGLTAVRAMTVAPFTHFLADESGTILLEIYCNPPEQVPDYGSMDPLLVHLAFVSSDPAGDRARLEAAGATVVSEAQLPDGDQLVMLRDPWGLALQLCQRAKSMLAG